MTVPCYPDFIPMDIELKDILHPRLSLTSDGISEFTFSSLYLYRKEYEFSISRENPDGGFIVSGKFKDKKLFMTPCCAPSWEILNDLYATHDYWESIPESFLPSLKEEFEKRGITAEEDRNNFDYLYYRKDLVELAGKKYHKKKNLVNQFLAAYPDHEQKQMNASLVPYALEILERWKEGKNEENDYKAAKEALDLFDSLPLRGSIFFIDGKPAAYCLGESIARGRMFAIHFEKAVEEYKGIYQYMNQAFASSLPRFFTLINREQDAGNEGLRQAKMTYRPCGFVRKYVGRIN